jgi:nucleoside-diphosphate-sugar epimerase
VPLPLHGDQFTTLTHAEDVASMLAAVIDNPAAVGQVSKRAVITDNLSVVITPVPVVTARTAVLTA